MNAHQKPRSSTSLTVSSLLWSIMTRPGSMSCSSTTVDQLMKILSDETRSSLSWFQINYMKANPDKFQLLCLGKNFDAELKHLNFENATLSATQSVHILGVTIDEKLKYDEHVSNLCKKAGKQLNVLMRLRSKLRQNSQKTGIQPFDYSDKVSSAISLKHSTACLLSYTNLKCGHHI